MPSFGPNHQFVNFCNKVVQHSFSHLLEGNSRIIWKAIKPFSSLKHFIKHLSSVVNGAMFVIKWRNIMTSQTCLRFLIEYFTEANKFSTAWFSENYSLMWWFYLFCEPLQATTKVDKAASRQSWSKTFDTPCICRWTSSVIMSSLMIQDYSFRTFVNRIPAFIIDMKACR